MGKVKIGKSLKSDQINNCKIIPNISSQILSTLNVFFQKSKQRYVIAHLIYYQEEVVVISILQEHLGKLSSENENLTAENKDHISP
jgi:hypothetical protein